MKRCCGPKGFFRTPEFVFTEACCLHDGAYQAGGRREHRLDADKRFYRDMVTSARMEARNRAELLWFMALAWLYYRAVRAYGGRFFNWRDDVTIVLDGKAYTAENVHKLIQELEKP